MILNEYGRTHIPMKFTWEMTEKCNLNCMMCYSRDCNSVNNIKNELTTEEVIKLLRILEKNEVLYLFLEGGEPLLREDFFKILRICTSKFCTWVSTNGTLIDKSAAKEFKESKIGTVFVSLHGHSSELHDKVTRTKGSFYATIKGIELLVEQDVSVMTAFQLSKLNVDYIEFYIKLCKELGVRKINFLRPYPLGNGKKYYSEFALSREQYLEAVKELEAKCRENDILFGHSFGEKNHNCCKQAFSSDSRGYLMNCPYLRFLPRLGNIFEKELIEIWNSNESQDIRASYKRISDDCQKCNNGSFCNGGCIASKLLETNNIKSKDPICWI